MEVGPNRRVKANGSLHVHPLWSFSHVYQRRARNIPKEPHVVPHRQLNRIPVNDIAMQRLLCHQCILNLRKLWDGDGKQNWETAAFLSRIARKTYSFFFIVNILFKWIGTDSSKAVAITTNIPFVHNQDNDKGKFHRKCQNFLISWH